MRKPRVLLSLFVRPNVFRRQKRARSPHSGLAIERDDASATSSRRAASQLESGLRGERAAGSALHMDSGDQAKSPIRGADQPAALLLADAPGQPARALDVDGRVAESNAGARTVLRDVGDILRDGAPAADDEQEQIAPGQLPVTASALQVCIAAICAMVMFYATEWLFIVKLAWPEVQQVICGGLGLFVFFAPALCFPATYYGSWTGLLYATLLTGLATVLFSLMRRIIFPTSV